MNTKIWAILAIVIIIVAAVGVYFALSTEDDDTTVNVTGNLPVYGNANNDNYINESDIVVLESLISEGTWNEDEFPYADANQDGVIDQSDIDLVRDIIEGNECTVYYVDWENSITSQSYPINADRICINRYFFAEVMDILGLYDNIVLASTNLSDNLSHMYDTSNIEYTYVGSKEPTTELILESDVDLIIADTWDGDVCEAAMTADPSISTFYIDIYSYGTLIKSVLILGLLTQTTDASTAYADFVDEINDYIEQGMVGVDPVDLIVVYTGSTISAGSTSIECWPCSSVCLMEPLANVYTIETTSNNNRTSVSDEWMIENYGDAYDYMLVLHEYTGYTQVDGTYYTQELFDERVEQLYEKFSAISMSEDQYVNVTFFSISFGCYAYLPMIAHMLYPDVFTEDAGWDYLQQYWDDFSSVDIDVRNQGGWFYLVD